jgi:hypothetical protein
MRMKERCTSIEFSVDIAKVLPLKDRTSRPRWRHVQVPADPNAVTLVDEEEKIANGSRVSLELDWERC